MGKGVHEGWGCGQSGLSISPSRLVLPFQGVGCTPWEKDSTLEL